MEEFTMKALQNYTLAALIAAPGCASFGANMQNTFNYGRTTMSQLVENLEQEGICYGEGNIHTVKGNIEDANLARTTAINRAVDDYKRRCLEDLTDKAAAFVGSVVSAEGLAKEYDSRTGEAVVYNVNGRK